jgi:hypothetical protein
VSPQQTQMIGEIFGWVETLFRALGVWDLLGMMLAVMIMIGSAQYVLRVFGGSR